MNALDKLRRLRDKDRSVRTWMRIIGAIVAIGSTYLLIRDISLNPFLDWFFGFCILIGVATIGLSWASGEQDQELQREALSEYMREQVKEREKQS